ncbi:MAG TPA: uroporphyrinogen decarboxylase family protein [Anaerolineae bacterium]|jgi:uroporphyrinogen decarboxylase
MNLTPRQRFVRIMHHQAADRVPIDLSGTSLTAAEPEVMSALMQATGTAGAARHELDSDDEPLLKTLGVDFRRVGSLVAGGETDIHGRPGFRKDIWGVIRKWTGQYWDIVECPLRGATIDDLDHYPWPDPAQIIAAVPLERYQRQAIRLWQETDYVVVAEHPVYGILELACWMCGFDDFLARLANDRPFVSRLFGKLLALQKSFIEPYYKALGPYIHLTTSGDDFGTQKGPFMSPRMFQDLVKPYFSERIAFTRQFTAGYFWHHTCGSVYDLIPDLIDSGVDILNPIQPGARNMEPERLKHDYGHLICFHGGFDTQGVLPYGNPESIETEVKRVMTALKPNGGYIFSAAHNIQSDVPVDNVLAMIKAAHKYGMYQLAD